MSEGPTQRPSARLLSEAEARVVTTVEPEPPIDDAPPASLQGGRRGGWGALFWAALGGLVTLALSLSLSRLIEELFARADLLGWLGLALVALLLVAAGVIVGREVRAILRLGRVEQFRERALTVLATENREEGRALSDDLRALYADRLDLARARAELDADLAGITDGADRIRIAERALFTDLDRQALRLVMQSAKRVSIVTAVSPRALFDILMVLAESARLVRALADLYGARPGTLGMLRLARGVASHLVITGGMAAGESLVQQLVGHGLAAKLSAKLGEGVINGLMTARIGLATVDLVRPLPFTVLERPKLGSVVAELTRVG